MIRENRQLQDRQVVVINLKWVNWTWQLAEDGFKMCVAEAEKANFPSTVLQLISDSSVDLSGADYLFFQAGSQCPLT